MSDEKRKKKKRARQAGIAVGAGVIAALAVVGGLTAMGVGERLTDTAAPPEHSGDAAHSEAAGH
ncbi:MAG: hypothetical protein GC189_09685 [Alphaproteobacteria bacterium]|nr:hypothetical protein [Alphaproteobacteria bacterium]